MEQHGSSTEEAVDFSSKKARWDAFECCAIVTKQIFKGESVSISCHTTYTHFSTFILSFRPASPHIFLLFFSRLPLTFLSCPVVLSSPWLLPVVQVASNLLLVNYSI
jgi:hypothetical protein